MKELFWVYNRNTKKEGKIINYKAENFILLVGPSGSGKTTICKELYRRYGLTSVQSYTSRPRRENEKDGDGHIFVDEEFFITHKELQDMVAYTVFDNYEYCATMEQIEENHIYVIDPQGVDTFVERYTGNKQYFVVYLKVNDEELLRRLTERDGETQAIQRMTHDKTAFADAENYADFVLEEDKISKIVTQIRHIWKYGTPC